MPKIDVARLNALRPLPKPSANPPETTNTHSDDAAEPIEFDKAPMGRTFRKRKGKVANHLKRTANEKEMENFKKRVFRIPLEKPFEEAYFTHRLWMFFRETRETEEDIRRMFCEAREKIKNRITLKKKSGPGKFTIPCTVKGIEFPHALWQIKREDQIPRQLLDYIMVEGNKQHRSEELSRAEEAETSYPTSALITTTNSTSIDTSSTTSIDGTTSTSTNITNITSIDDSTLKSIDISSCDPTLDEEKEITMEDFLELEEFLELEDGEKLEDLDSSRKVTMGDFLELEEWLKDMDQNSKKKLDDDQHTSRGDLETSPKASIDRHQPNEIDRQPSYIIDQRPPYIIDRKSADSIDLHPHSIIDRHPPNCIDQHPWLDELP
ncbi:hypothetical protein F2Q70_00025941 [Brassica cretica]|uniref:Uncharacterized protein n=1 Tax=Brassica cretica TaxID=69181 RepID=A0A8S9LFV1_BRACR|nr:hypothetical protein F2Q70_00025941 [Brassica cretica]